MTMASVTSKEDDNAINGRPLTTSPEDDESSARHSTQHTNSPKSTIGSCEKVFRKIVEDIICESFDAEFGGEDDEVDLSLVEASPHIKQDQCSEDNIVTEMTTLFEHVSANDLLVKVDEITEMSTRLKKLEKSIQQIMIAQASNQTAELQQDPNEFTTKLEDISSKFENSMKEKVNLTDLEDRLAEKADAVKFEGLVPREIFEDACTDLTFGIEDNASCLKKQEEEYQRRADGLEKLLECKLDKEEMMTLKEFVAYKLSKMNDKLRKLIKAREAEAGAVRSRVLRNANCIVCDANVVMRADWKPQRPHKALSTRYLTRSSINPGSPGAPPVGYKAEPQRQQRADVDNDKEGPPSCSCSCSNGQISTRIPHICQRYCGGSHTLTTANERIIRKGNFADFLKHLSGRKAKSTAVAAPNGSI